MADSFGPRTYLVGRILSALLTRNTWTDYDDVATIAVRIADKTLNAMSRSDGRPTPVPAPPSATG